MLSIFVRKFAWGASQQPSSFPLSLRWTRAYTLYTTAAVAIEKVSCCCCSHRMIRDHHDHWSRPLCFAKPLRGQFHRRRWDSVERFPPHMSEMIHGRRFETKVRNSNFESARWRVLLYDCIRKVHKIFIRMYPVYAAWQPICPWPLATGPGLRPGHIIFKFSFWPVNHRLLISSPKKASKTSGISTQMHCRANQLQNCIFSIHLAALTGDCSIKIWSNDPSIFWTFQCF